MNVPVFVYDIRLDRDLIARRVSEVETYLESNFSKILGGTTDNGNRTFAL